MPAPSDPSDKTPDFSFLGDDSFGGESEQDLNAGAFDFDNAGLEENKTNDGAERSDTDTPPSPTARPTLPKPAPQVTSNAKKSPEDNQPARSVTDPAAPPKAFGKRASAEIAHEATGTPRSQTATKASSKTRSAQADGTVATSEQASGSRKTHSKPNSDTHADAELSGTTDMVSKKAFSIVAGYAAAITLLFLALLVMGRVSLFGAHPLESLPDIRPLENNEFQKVPPTAELPANHTLALGESRRFGDIILTAERVSREPVKFVHMSTAASADNMTTGPVLKLWLKMENVSSNVAFPPFEVALMCSRSPAQGIDESTDANSWLMVSRTGSDQETRVLNLLHSADSSFDLVGQNSRKVLQPGESMETYVACSRTIAEIDEASIEGFRWRIQFRKGVNPASGNGVTTLVDVRFSTNDVKS